ncbi:SDR family oxidoreductase [Halomonas aquamarina]|uniref:SDR family oxidoreductase n=1 Tax=Vreelandella aquamarina TaxID=77097 RepID=A0ACC5VV60_9GAMM|nr:SDR family oxidoreductase [Halomonas aquamarina]MBZ5487419.1 SDR family oxidoreductase [Halomonas aquamarina]
MSDTGRAVVIGASRGIGLGLAGEFLTRGWQVTATAREGADNEALKALGERHGDRLAIRSVELADLSGVEQLADHAPIDALVIVAGIMGPSHQRAEQATPAELGALFWTNAAAPIALARRLLSAVRRGGSVVFISSRMGSVTLNEEGDRELYRASKAALNSLSRGLACHEARAAGVGVLNLHPGWVKTDMGGDDAPVTVEQSASGIVDVVSAHFNNPGQRFLDYTGAPLAW